MTVQHRKKPSGSARQYRDFDDYLTRQGVKAEIDIAVEKRVIARQVLDELAERGLTKSEFAAQIGTSRAQLDRILDSTSQNITLASLKRVALALGMNLHFGFSKT